MSSLDYEETIKLLHHHVFVRTTVKRGPDFKSPFICSPKLAYDNEDVSDTLHFAGYLKVLDPISRSAILCLINSENLYIEQNLLILGQNIDLITPSQISQETLSVAEVRDIVAADSAKKLYTIPFFQKLNKYNTNNTNREETLRTGLEISEWLSANRIPHQLNPDTCEIVIGEVARLHPPYENESNYICPTRIMLKRIIHIVNSRPHRLTSTAQDD